MTQKILEKRGLLPATPETNGQATEEPATPVKAEPVKTRRTAAATPSES